MRQRASLVISMACLLLPVAGCGDGGGGVFADVRYYVQCPSGVTGCTAGDRIDIFGFDGKPNEGETSTGADVRAECRFTDLDSGNVLLEARASIGLDPQIRFRQVVLPSMGGSVIGTAGELSIVDDAVTFESKVGANAPSAQIPCQMQAPVIVDRNGEFGPTVEIKLRCDRMTAPADPTRFIRNVRLAPDAQAEPATLRFINCENFPR